MIIWIVNPYGDLPTEEWSDYRCTLIAKELTKMNYKVVWWTAGFNHRDKKFRTKEFKKVQIDVNFTINLVPTVGYIDNISIKRIIFEKIFGYNFYKFAKHQIRPDLIILSFPSLWCGKYCLKLKKHFNIKVLVDILDLWPELFKLYLPKKLKKWDKLIYGLLYKKRANLFKKTDAFVAVSKTYLDLARNINPQLEDKYYKTIYIGSDINSIKYEYEEIEEFKSLFLNKNVLYAIYAGSLGMNYDIETLIKSFMSIDPRKIKLIIAGSGPLENYIVNTIKQNNADNIIYLGKIKKTNLNWVYKYCDIGLMTYSNESTVSLPVKIFDYLACGLPIVNSLDGEAKDLIIKNKLGWQYNAGDKESLKSVLIQILENENERMIYSENALKLSNSFDTQLQYEKYGKFLVELFN